MIITHPKVEWTFVFPSDGEAALDGEVDALLGELHSAGLIDLCEECSDETTGTILHNAPGHTSGEIERAVFAATFGD